MPRTGTPRAKIFGSHRGAFGSYTLLGPPERIRPLRFRFFNSSAGMSGRTNSLKTPFSRTRRAMSWAYWEPKSRMGITSSRCIPHYYHSPASRSTPARTGELRSERSHVCLASLSRYSGRGQGEGDLANAVPRRCEHPAVEIARAPGGRSYRSTWFSKSPSPPPSPGVPGEGGRTRRAPRALARRIAGSGVALHSGKSAPRLLLGLGGGRQINDAGGVDEHLHRAADADGLAVPELPQVGAATEAGVCGPVEEEAVVHVRQHLVAPDADHQRVADAGLQAVEFPADDRGVPRPVDEVCRSVARLPRHGALADGERDQVEADVARGGELDPEVVLLGRPAGELEQVPPAPARLQVASAPPPSALDDVAI